MHFRGAPRGERVHSRHGAPAFGLHIGALLQKKERGILTSRTRRILAGGEE